MRFPSQLIAGCSWCMPAIPSYLRGWDQEDGCFRPIPGKKFVRPHINGKTLGVVVHTWHPNYGKNHKIWESCSRPAWTNVRPYVQNNQWKNRLGSMPQAIEQAASKLKVLSSKPGTTTKKKTMFWAITAVTVEFQELLSEFHASTSLIPC
jgi:hypothetical protein